MPRRGRDRGKRLGRRLAVPRLAVRLSAVPSAERVPERVNSANARLRDLPDHVGRLLAHHELLWTWTARELKVRYSQSLLGVAWAILQPVALMVVFTVVFSFLSRIPSDGAPYPIFAYAGLLPWTFFSSAISFAIPSLVGQMGLVTKTYFPREILPLATVLASLVDFSIAAILLLALMLFYRVPFGLPLLALLPVVVAQLFLTFGLVLVGSALNVFYRDLRFVVPLALQIWMYLSPVIYPSSLVPTAWQAVYRLNPLVGIIESYRQILVLSEWPDWSTLQASLVWALGACLVGYAFFKRVEMRFADSI